MGHKPHKSGKLRAVVRELTATIGAFIDGWNEHPRPFAWTKDADEILAKVERAKANTSTLTHH
jgi:hypothetical protein